MPRHVVLQAAEEILRGDLLFVVEAEEKSEAEQALLVEDGGAVRVVGGGDHEIVLLEQAAIVVVEEFRATVGGGEEQLVVNVGMEGLLIALGVSLQKALGMGEKIKLHVLDDPRVGVEFKLIRHGELLSQKNGDCLYYTIPFAKLQPCGENFLLGDAGRGEV